MIKDMRTKTLEFLLDFKKRDMPLIAKATFPIRYNILGIFSKGIQTYVTGKLGYLFDIVYTMSQDDYCESKERTFVMINELFYYDLPKNYKFIQLVEWNDGTKGVVFEIIDNTEIEKE